MNTDSEFFHSTEWRRLRRETLKRDGYRCRVRDCEVRGSALLTVHHIVPRAEGGSHALRNLITLCPAHHDQIELARVWTIPQIETWNGVKPAAPTVTSIILDGVHASKQEKEIQGDSRWKKVHLCADSTVAAINRRLVGRTLADICRELDHHVSFSATLSAILRDKPGAISAEGEDELRRRLDLIPINPVLTPRCPTCGGVHVADDCHGREGTAQIKRERRRRVVNLRLLPDDIGISPEIRPVCPPRSERVAPDWAYELNEQVERNPDLLKWMRGQVNPPSGRGDNQPLPLVNPWRWLKEREHA